MAGELAKYTARICWNTQSWVQPTGVAHQAESQSYSSKYRYGHEEWLFDLGRLVDGWHYAYLTPVSRSHNKILRSGSRLIHMLLWTKDPQGARWYVGELKKAEVLDPSQGNHAVSVYKRLGWFKSMESQLNAIGINGRAFLKNKPYHWFFNVRFKPSDAELYDPARRASQSDAIFSTGRYALIRASDGIAEQWRRRAAATGSRNFAPVARRAVGPTTMAREHGRLQDRLFKILAAKYGAGAVSKELDFVDIVCDMDDVKHFIEVKMDPRPRAAIREAIGQLLEYACSPQCRATTAPRLHVAAPGECTSDVKEYLDALRARYGVQLRYHQVSMETESLSLD